MKAMVMRVRSAQAGVPNVGRMIEAAWTTIQPATA